MARIVRNVSDRNLVFDRHEVKAGETIALDDAVASALLGETAGYAPNPNFEAVGPADDTHRMPAILIAEIRCAGPRDRRRMCRRLIARVYFDPSLPRPWRLAIQDMRGTKQRPVPDIHPVPVIDPARSAYRDATYGIRYCRDHDRTRMAESWSIRHRDLPDALVVVDAFRRFERTRQVQTILWMPNTNAMLIATA